MKKISLITLGCAKNLVDSEMVLGLIKKMGYEITPFKDSSDLIIINTCGFIEPAKKEAIDVILDNIINKRPNQRVMVIGCLATRYKEDLEKEIPEIDKVVSIKDYKNLSLYISTLLEDKTSCYNLNFHNRVLSTPIYSAYVRIGDGCDNNCAYCAIPLIRGGFNSRRIDDVVSEVKELVDKGIKEIVLIAQDTTRFGKETGERIEDLLLKIDDIENIDMVRLLYLYPDEISDELIEIIAHSKHIAHYFDIPIQHASDRILKSMNRRGNSDDIARIYKKIKYSMDDAILRTTVMVGFPGESDEDFNKLCNFIEQYPFDRLGAFTYSAEEDTRACNMEQIEEDIKKIRYEKLMNLQTSIAKQLSKEKIGKVYECYVDGYSYDHKMYQARSYAFSGDETDGYIYFKSNELVKIGSKIKLKIVDSLVYDLIGEKI